MNASEWKQLIDEQLSSGLSVHEYCLSKAIKKKTFYSKRSVMGLSPHQAKPAKSAVPASSFIKAQLESTIPPINQLNPLSLMIDNQLTLSFSETVSVCWLARLIKELKSC